MAEVPEGYKIIPETEQKKAQVFFNRGKTVADTGNYEYAIELYLQGLAVDPEAIDAHQMLRDIALKRKVSGGKDLGMFDKMKLKRPSKDDKQNMLGAEKLLAYDPGNVDGMVSLIQSAHRAGFYDTVLWLGPILLRANSDSKSPDFNKYIILKNIYKDLKHWKKATEACHYAAALRPEDMNLQTELKDLGANDTMSTGRYEEGGSFRNSIRDMGAQQKLIDQDKDVRSLDMLERAVAEAEAEWKANPDDTNLRKLVDALERTESPEYENRAIELLEEAYGRTMQFQFRRRIGEIKMTQLRRMERSLRTALRETPNDEPLKKDYSQFRVEQAEFELSEYRLWSQNYPTDIGLKYQTSVRLFALRHYDEAIPLLQQARSDPKHRIEAGIYLARAFLEAGFVDESIDTFNALIEEYQLKGDDKSREMYYWSARSLEQKGDKELAVKRYSQVAQWDFNYRDVQARIKRLRGGG